MFRTVERTPEGVRLLDQRKLPREVAYVTCATADAVAFAIRAMVVRGAPAIGITAAFGLALAASQAEGEEPEVADRAIASASASLAAARPTAPRVRRERETPRSPRV
jgi:methylthioribose-1-phosphate isomerase